MNNSTSNARLTKQELTIAKQILAQRNEKTRTSGFEQKLCDPEFRDYYHPRTPTGKQIYMSYTGEELLDILITYMEHPGHSPDWEKVHHVYKLYLNWRFGNLPQAKEKARARQKALMQQAKWPPDWPERVNPEPLYQWMAEKGKELTEEHRNNIEGLCKTARETGMPPDLSSPECQLLGKICNYKKALEMMNIPALRKTELRFMARYWKENREK